MSQSIPPTRSLSLGAATITIINVGDMTEFLKDWIILPESDRPADYARVFEQPMHVPIQCVHIALNGRSILVDAGKFDPPGAPVRPRLTDGLAAIGVNPEDITDVVVTHAHWDHYNATTALSDGEYAPQFPKARHFFGKADCESILNGEAMREAGSMENQTLGVLNRAGLLARSRVILIWTSAFESSPRRAKPRVIRCCACAQADTRSSAWAICTTIRSKSNGPSGW
ncbi:MAG: MBL fold metallo-hydrolase [Thermoflexales bacterium]